MASPSEATFRLQLLFDQERYNQTVTTFHDRISEEDYARPVFRLLENVPVRLLFDAPDKTSRLYMYGLDEVPGDRVEVDEDGELYLKPSAEPVALHSFGDYPLIPGTYLLRVVSGERTFLAPFLIESKQVSGSQLEQMKQELEEIMKGLTFDLVHRLYAAAPEERGQVLPPPLLRKFMILDRHYPTLMSALTDLYDRVNHRIRKSYRWTPEERATALDQVSIRSLYGQSRLPGYVRTPHREVDHDLPENQWVKRMISRLASFFDEFVQNLQLHRQQIELEIEELLPYQQFQERSASAINEKRKELDTIDGYIGRVDQMRRGLRLITSAAWYQEVEMKPRVHIPHVLATDSRYRALYQLYRELSEDQLQVTLHPMYNFQWKRTEKLYEMWGFTRILKALVDHAGFRPISGWIYDHRATSDAYIVPVLPPGERIVLVRGEWRLNLVYDGQLPLVLGDTSERELPLSLGKNNRPDTRIDYYLHDIYAGSLLVDFKYRPIRNFWVEAKRNSRQRLREMDQLIAYVRDSRSEHLYGDRGKGLRLFDPRPVLEAWAIYAETREHERASYYIEDERIRLIPFNPGDDIRMIVRMLDDVLQQVKEKFDWVYQQR